MGRHHARRPAVGARRARGGFTASSTAQDRVDGLGRAFSQTGSLPAVRASRMAVLLALPAVMVPQAAIAASRSVQSVTTISMTMAHAYKPHAASGTTDDYHCTLLNPHVTWNAYIVSSQFVHGSSE